jgi:N6-L-threonylcarbamoyladenine synthase
LLILGIDSSCDDTSAAVVADGRHALSNVVHSQVRLHRPHGGVVPELASREHLKNIGPVVREALKNAGAGLKDIEGVAVTVGPGLIGSLLVGLYYAKSLAYCREIPLLGVNHLEGHILSIFLEERLPEFPFVALTVSGGHTSIYMVEDYGRYRRMAHTVDDAAGEAFDKAAKVMGLGYPGGAVIERLAEEGSSDSVKFPRPMLSGGSIDFSFSGLKTALILYLKKWSVSGCDSREVRLSDIAASFQEAVIEVLANKLVSAVRMTKVRSVVLAGGVACNKRLRGRVEDAISGEGAGLFYPRASFCTDNGAMIAVAGYHRLLKGQKADLGIDVKSRFPIDELEGSLT